MIGFRAFLWYRNNKSGFCCRLQSAYNLWIRRRTSADKLLSRISNSVLWFFQAFHMRNAKGEPDCPDSTIWSRELVRTDDNSLVNRLYRDYTSLPYTTTIRWW